MAERKGCGCLAGVFVLIIVAAVAALFFIGRGDVKVPDLAPGQPTTAPGADPATPALPEPDDVHPIAPEDLATITGSVLGVPEGDVITVMHGRDVAKVRLYGIDCPEKGQDFSQEATKFTSDACLNKTLTVTVRGKDRRGRSVGDVLLPGGRNLNHELLAAGLAWWYPQHAPQDAALQGLEAEAKSADRGLWADLAPTPPWEHRNEARQTRIERARQKAVDRKKAGITVYITGDNKSYHRGTCRRLKTSKRPISLKNARKRGFTPCELCKPEE